MLSTRIMPVGIGEEEGDTMENDTNRTEEEALKHENTLTRGQFERIEGVRERLEVTNKRERTDEENMREGRVREG